ncbi:hypothetical protein AXF42_Ash007536 [Apostasia shenzhenica]|uniref:Fanconi anemia group D2 protein n=1 Tax=Apostasia shenzhenica TaxID=1088818 RepID=A0A2I0A5R1_9ASPA|nr:hypothetical protein AXF42_Ash007536 [Apostasia shenzhenica]
MVFLRRINSGNPRKRPAAPSADLHLSSTAVFPRSPCRLRSTAIAAAGISDADGKGEGVSKVNIQSVRGRGDDREQDVSLMVSLLAEAGCTIRVSGDFPPSLPADPHKLCRHLENCLSLASDRVSLFVSGFSSYIRNSQNLRRVLVPASHDGSVGSARESLVRLLLLVAPIQPQLLNLLLEKLPEHFNADTIGGNCSLKDDIARLIVNQFRWLDFLVDSEGFAEKLMEVLSICPSGLKKEIIGSLPEIIGDKSHGTVVTALEKMLLEDSEVIVPVLDSFSNLNLDEHLREQAVTIALSCIRTADGEHMPHLLKFLLSSTTSANAGRIISQIREQLKIIGVVDPYFVRNKKLKEKSLAYSTEASILDALKSSLQFKTVDTEILCDAVLKELKSIAEPRYHKVIDIWFLLLICSNGGSLLKSAQKLLKRKIISGCLSEALFDQCISGHRELVKDYFPSFVSISEYLLSSKEKEARNFGIHLYVALFQEFKDTYSRQEVLGVLVTHIGSGIAYEVSSALETLIILTSRYSEQLITMSSHITGILDYMDSFEEDNLHKVYDVFCHLVLSSQSSTDMGSSLANEVMMIIRKQVSNANLVYRKMGIIGTLKIVSLLGEVNAPIRILSSQKSNFEDAFDLLQMCLDSCKLFPLTLILLYDELIALLEHSVLKPAILEWLSKHVGEFESKFLSDVEGGQLPLNVSSDGIEGVHHLCRFFLLSFCYCLLLTNHGSLAGIDALLGCPLHLPSTKYLSEVHWKRLTEKQKQTVCLSLYYAINWIRELLNAFGTQISSEVASVTPNTKNVMAKKLLKRLRNLMYPQTFTDGIRRNLDHVLIIDFSSCSVMESILDVLLKAHPTSFPEVRYHVKQSGSSIFFKKKSLEGTLSETIPLKRKKIKKTDSPTSENSDLNTQLRQPMIINVLKKAGALASRVSDESSRHTSNEKSPQCAEGHCFGPNDLGGADISTALKTLDAQRSNFRPLNVDSLSLLCFSESRKINLLEFFGLPNSVTEIFLCLVHFGNLFLGYVPVGTSPNVVCKNSCCADPAAELPLHLYLLRDLHQKLDDLTSTSTHLQTASPVKASIGFCRMTTIDLLSKIRPLFGSLRKYLDIAFSVLSSGSKVCEDHWNALSRSAGNPYLPNLKVSETSVASSVIREVLSCYSRMLCLEDLYCRENSQILRDILEAFQLTEIPTNFFLGLEPVPTPGTMDYLYCGVFAFLEDILEAGKSVSLSYLLASEVLITLHSLVNLKLISSKCGEPNGMKVQVRCSNQVLHYLTSRLGLSANKILLHEWGSEDNENYLKGKSDTIQKILRIYLTNSESTCDTLRELACSTLPQIEIEAKLSIQSWLRSDRLEIESLITLMDILKGIRAVFIDLPYHVLIIAPSSWMQHEENISVLRKLIKEVKHKNGENNQRQLAGEMLVKIRQSVNVIVALISLCKVHEKLRELQKATRIIHALCCEAKGSKQTMVTSKIPATKRSMERFLFHVKSLIHNNTSNGCVFWMGNLKHKDLYGQVVSSQAYTDGDDDADHAEENHSGEELRESVGDHDQEIDQN